MRRARKWPLEAPSRPASASTSQLSTSFLVVVQLTRTLCVPSARFFDDRITVSFGESSNTPKSPENASNRMITRIAPLPACEAKRGGSRSRFGGCHASSPAHSCCRTSCEQHGAASIFCLRIRANDIDCACGSINRARPKSRRHNQGREGGSHESVEAVRRHLSKRKRQRQRAPRSCVMRRRVQWWAPRLMLAAAWPVPPSPSLRLRLLALRARRSPCSPRRALFGQPFGASAVHQRSTIVYER